MGARISERAYLKLVKQCGDIGCSTAELIRGIIETEMEEKKVRQEDEPEPGTITITR